MAWLGSSSGFLIKLQSMCWPEQRLTLRKNPLLNSHTWLFAEFSSFWAVWLRAEFPNWLLASFPKFFATGLKIAICQASKREGLLVRWKTESFNLIMEVESSRCWGIPFVRSKLLQEKASYLNLLIPGNNNQWDQPTSYIPQQFRSVCIHFWRWYARNSFQSTKLSINEGVRDARKIGVIIRTKGQMLHGDYSCPWQVPRVSSELYQFVLSLSHVRLFLTPWAVARQASLSITSSQSLCKLMSHRIVDAIQPSHPLSSPSPPAFSLSQH